MKIQLRFILCVVCIAGFFNPVFGAVSSLDDWIDDITNTLPVNGGGGSLDDNNFYLCYKNENAACGDMQKPPSACSEYNPVCVYNVSGLNQSSITDETDKKTLVDCTTCNEGYSLEASGFRTFEDWGCYFSFSYCVCDASKCSKRYSETNVIGGKKKCYYYCAEDGSCSVSNNCEIACNSGYYLSGGECKLCPETGLLDLEGKSVYPKSSKATSVTGCYIGAGKYKTSTGHTVVFDSNVYNSGDVD